MESVEKTNIFVDWFFWQFYQMPIFLFEVWNNYFIFATNYFSLPLLLKTFFSPWRRYKWMYPKGFDAFEFFNTFVSNTVSRILGAFMRIVLIIVGICLQIFVVVSGLIVFVVWLLLPLIIIAGLLFVFIY
jgi:hypothetical protein